jgi:immunity protein 74 of polymorphic toxin system
MQIATFSNIFSTTNMLYKTDNKSVRGPHFTVTIPDIHKVEYSESGKVATIEIEGGTSEPGQVDWLVYAQTFQGWLPPHESEEITAEKRRQILKDVSEALSMLGMPHKIIDN